MTSRNSIQKKYSRKSNYILAILITSLGILFPSCNHASKTSSNIKELLTLQLAQALTTGAIGSAYSSISIAPDTSIYAAGHIYGTGINTFGTGVTANGTVLSNSAVVVNYNSSGVAQWARTVTTVSMDPNDESFFNSISVAPDNSAVY